MLLQWKPRKKTNQLSSDKAHCKCDKPWESETNQSNMRLQDDRAESGLPTCMSESMNTV